MSTQSTKGQLATHQLSHTGDRPTFECSLCSWSSFYKGHLKEHEITHSGETPFSCTVCHYSTNRKSSLTRHKRDLHTGGKPFECDVCEFSSVYSRTLAEHKASHSDIRAYRCPHCDHTAKTKTKLGAHIRRMHPVSV